MGAYVAVENDRQIPPYRLGDYLPMVRCPNGCDPEK